MTILFGTMLLISLAAIGRDGRVLPLHGLWAGACAATGSDDPVALSACFLLPFLNVAAWALLRPYVIYRLDETHERRLGRQASALAASAAILLVFLVALAATPRLPLLFCIGTVMAGLCSTALRHPLQQCVGLICTLNGLILLGGVTLNASLVLASAALSLGLMMRARKLMPRLAWLKVEVLPHE